MLLRWLLTISVVKGIKLVSFVVVILWILQSILVLLESRSGSVKLGGTKTILVWNKAFGKDDYDFGKGVDPFVRSSCRVTDCYMSVDRSWIPVDSYDAIVFHGPEYHPEENMEYPSRRKAFQRYVYVSQESPDKFPVSPSIPDGFFNVTMTYRTDSDIVAPYFFLYDESGRHVAPAHAPAWIQPHMKEERLEFYKKIHENKRKPIAWFVSNCYTPNGREHVAEELGKWLQVDIYGDCGDFTCPRGEECGEMLKKDYYFYLSFENSNCEDYVTEKVITAYENYAIPIVYGGANYSKILPPKSYLDANLLTAEEIADTVKALMDDPEEYSSYFWWKDFYTIGNELAFCDLCELLHSDPPPKSYNMQRWWHGTEDKPKCEKIA